MSATLIANAALLKTGIPTPLGSLSTVNSPLQFGLPDITGMYRGQLTVIASGGAVSPPTWVLECSIDQGATWFLISSAIVLTASTPTSGQISGDTAPLYAARYDVSGLSGSAMKFGLTAGSSITATNIYALVG